MLRGEEGITMHIPDGFMDASTSLGAAVAASGGVGLAVKKTSGYLDDREVPLAGLVAAFVFAAQMLSFPVAAGTSGHLLGGVLAGVLVGPWAGVLCMTVVLLVQSLFADGGLSALGLNVLNIAVVGGLGGYALFAVMRRLLPRTHVAVVFASGAAAAGSVVLASIAFVIEYGLGATTSISLGTVAAAMVGVHVLIGIGEAVITATTVATVLGVRPDLVYGARGLAPPAPAEAEASPAVGG
jgi:cobalt/nickel transport system permease protein